MRSLLDVLPVPPAAFPLVNLQSILVSVLWICSIGVACYMTFLQARKVNLAVAEKTAEGWEGLYRMKEEEFNSLRNRISDMETQITILRRENEAFRQLNLDLQGENHALKDEQRRLQARIEELERQVRDRHELRDENDELRKELRALRDRLAKYETPHEA